MGVFKNVQIFIGNWSVFLGTDAYVRIVDINSHKLLYMKYAPNCRKQEHLQAYVEDYKRFLKEYEAMKRGDMFA